jgi:hypothetical protein
MEFLTRPPTGDAAVSGIRDKERMAGTSIGRVTLLSEDNRGGLVSIPLRGCYLILRLRDANNITNAKTNSDDERVP